MEVSAVVKFIAEGNQMVTAETDNQIVLPVTIRACFSTYFVLGALCGIPALGATVASALQDAWVPAACFGFCFTLLVVWLISFRIVLKDDGVTFVRLFGGKASLPYEAIANARIEMGWATRADRLKGAYRLVILPLDRAAKRMEINIKVFSRRDLTLMMKVLSIKAPGAQLDSRCARMCQGKMPSLFFQSQ